MTTERKFDTVHDTVHDTTQHPEFIMEDCDFLQLGELGNLGTITSFVTDHVLNHTILNPALMLSKLSEMYVLTANKGSDHYVRDGEKKWRDVLSDRDYQSLLTQRSVILSWMIVENAGTESEFSIVLLVDTLVRGLGLTEYMFERFRHREHKQVVPGNILPTAILFWSRWFAKQEFFIDLTLEDLSENEEGITRKIIEHTDGSDTEVITTSLGKLYSKIGEHHGSVSFHIHLNWFHWELRIETDTDIYGECVSRYTVNP